MINTEKRNLVLNWMMAACAICFFVSIYLSYGWQGLVVVIDLICEILKVLAGS